MFDLPVSKGLSHDKVRIQQTCIAALACTAAWSCRRRTLYRYHQGDISSHMRPRLEHSRLPGANPCRW